MLFAGVAISGCVFPGYEPPAQRTPFDRGVYPLDRAVGECQEGLDGYEVLVDLVLRDDLYLGHLLLSEDRIGIFLAVFLEVVLDDVRASPMRRLPCA